MRRALLDAILFGELAPPVRLFPAELAVRFGVSITPVREALARLASEGFIEAIPRHGYHVRSPTPDYIAELWAVRLALELMAGEALLRRFPLAQERHAALTPLHALHAKLARSAASPHREHVALNGRFHDTLVELAGNALLTATYHGIRVRLFVAWVQRGSRAWRARLQHEQAEHQAVLDALDAGDAAALDRAIRQHLARSLDDALADLREASWGKARTNGRKHHAAVHVHDPGGGAGAAAAPPGRCRPKLADDAADVDVPEPRRHKPAREGAG